jgi:hypothetical protein
MGIADWLRRRLGGEAETDRPEDAETAEDDERSDDEPLDEDDDPTTYPLW